jgi:hypothetical protein
VPATDIVDTDFCSFRRVSLPDVILRIGALGNLVISSVRQNVSFPVGLADRQAHKARTCAR